MIPSILVFDEFYTNPYQVRDHALNLSFDTVGNYPGRRSCPEPQQQSEYLKNYFETELLHCKITDWHNEYNTCYQYTTEEAETWMHNDNSDWAGVLYLTPNAPTESGTGIYESISENPNSNSLDDWKQIDSMGNKFNRLVLYRGYLQHRSILPGFGKNKETGRLFQTFFFNTGE